MVSEKSAVEKLAMDFRRWGKQETLRIQAGVKKWGVIFETYIRDGKG